MAPQKWATWWDWIFSSPPLEFFAKITLPCIALKSKDCNEHDWYNYFEVWLGYFHIQFRKHQKIFFFLMYVITMKYVFDYYSARYLQFERVTWNHSFKWNILFFAKTYKKRRIITFLLSKKLRIELNFFRKVAKQLYFQ